MKRCYKVSVMTPPGHAEYEVWADSREDAQVIAFILDGGFSRGLTKMEDGHIQLALMYTEILGTNILGSP